MKAMVFDSESSIQKVSDLIEGEGIVIESASDGKGALNVLGGEREQVVSYPGRGWRA